MQFLSTQLHKNWTDEEMCGGQEFKTEWNWVQISVSLLISYVLLRLITYFSALKFAYLLTEKNDISLSQSLWGMNHFKYVKHLEPSIEDT